MKDVKINPGNYRIHNIFKDWLRNICKKKGHKWSKHSLGKYCLRCRTTKKYQESIK